MKPQAVMEADFTEHSAEPFAQGQPSGLLGGVRRLAGTVLETLKTRLDLVRTELKEEVHWAAQIVVWSFVCLMAFTITLFLGALTIVFAFWETARLAASLAVTASFLLIGVIAVAVLLVKLRSRPKVLEDTLEELSKDVKHLRMHT